MFGSYELIVNQKIGHWFDKNLPNTGGVVNADDPDNARYCIIGTFDAAKQERYRTLDRNGSSVFKLKLVYQNQDSSEDELIWTQTSWITTSGDPGADLSQIPSQSVHTSSQFRGLSLSTRTDEAWIDGSHHHDNWWQAVVQYRGWSGGYIPGFNGKKAVSYQLYIFRGIIVCDLNTSTLNESIIFQQ